MPVTRLSGRGEVALVREGHAGRGQERQEPATHVGFLVHDSRSGSTLLSKTLSDRLENVVVTPEISLAPLLLGRKRVDLPGGRRALRRFLQGPQVRNLELLETEIETLLSRLGERFTVKAAIEQTARVYAERAMAGSGPGATVIVKNGQHAFCWKRIQHILGPGVPFIHIYREMP